jgi:hypothetical protein
MRQFLLAAAMAIGLIALWAAILPLTAQPAPAQPTPAFSKALFLCRGSHGIDQSCAAALAKALVLDGHATTPVRANNRTCHADPQVFASSYRRD